MRKKKKRPEAPQAKLHEDHVAPKVHSEDAPIPLTSAKGPRRKKLRRVPIAEQQGTQVAPAQDLPVTIKKVMGKRKKVAQSACG